MLDDFICYWSAEETGDQEEYEFFQSYVYDGDQPNGKARDFDSCSKGSIPLSPAALAPAYIN